jgi:hypothetical protein
MLAGNPFRVGELNVAGRDGHGQLGVNQAARDVARVDVELDGLRKRENARKTKENEQPRQACFHKIPPAFDDTNGLQACRPR